MSETPADGVCWRTRGPGSSWRKQLWFVSQGGLAAFTLGDEVCTPLLKKLAGGAASLHSRAPAAAALLLCSSAGPRWVSAGPVALLEGIWPGAVPGLVPWTVLSAGRCQCGVPRCQRRQPVPPSASSSAGLPLHTPGCWGCPALGSQQRCWSALGHVSRGSCRVSQSISVGEKAQLAPSLCISTGWETSYLPFWTNHEENHEVLPHF